MNSCCLVEYVVGRTKRLLNASRDATDSNETMALEFNRNLFDSMSIFATTWGIATVDATKFPVSAEETLPITTDTKWFRCANDSEIFTNALCSALFLECRRKASTLQKATIITKTMKDFILNRGLKPTDGTLPNRACSAFLIDCRNSTPWNLIFKSLSQVKPKLSSYISRPIG